MSLKAGFLTLVLALAACGSGSETPAAGPSPQANSTPQATGSITVFAAASLTDAFNEIGTAFKAANPQASVTFMFAGSSGLRTQLEQGARADVFASADTVQMKTALQNGVVSDAGKVFVRNTPTIIVPSSNRAGVNAPIDLAKPGLKLVLAQAAVPIGNYARQVLGNLAKDATYGADFRDRVLKNLVSEESDVKQVVAKVQLGEADAGVVYSTDITSAVASQLKVIPFPAQSNVIADYPIAAIKSAGNAAGAQAFITFVLSPAGQAILKKYGFQTVGS